MRDNTPPPRWYLECDAAIRAGQLSRAKSLLAHVKKPHPPVLWAEILRRTGSYLKAARVLHPRIFHERRKKREPPSPQERREYAATLARLGALPEANEILQSSLDAADLENTLWTRHFLGLLRLEVWDFAAALEHFRWIQARGRLPHLLGLSQINEIFCLIELGEYKDAILKCESVLRQAHAPSLIYASTLSLLSEALVLSGRYGEALRHLQSTGTYLKDLKESHYFNHWQKTEALLKLKTQKYPDSEIQTLTRHFEKTGFWEGRRRLLFEVAKHRESAQDLLLLYIGSPLPGFKEQVRVALQALGTSLPERCMVTFKGSVLSVTKRRTSQICLTSGQLEGRPWIAAGQSLHLLLKGLFEERHRPARIASLHALMSTTPFHPSSSPLCVHQNLHRLRRALKPLALEIQESQGEYRLTSQKAVGFELELSPLPPTRTGHQVAWLKRIHASDLNSRDIARHLGCSLRSAQGLISEALAQGELEQISAGPQTRYRLKRKGP